MVKIKFTYKEGIILALICCIIWKLKNKHTKVYIDNYRLHHFQIGIGLLLAGIISKEDFLSGFGSILIIDDLDDFIAAINKIMQKN